MRRLVAVGLLIIAGVVAVPVVGFVTARNAPVAACGSNPGSFPFEGDGPASVSSPGARLQVRVASWNVLSGNGTARIVAGIRAVGRLADVIGVQELNPESRRRTVARTLAPEWAVSAGNNSVQIFWRRARFELLAEGSEEVFGLKRIEAGVAGTSIGPKSIQWVQLRDRQSGAVFFTTNHHLVPSIDHRGRPDTSMPRRQQLAGKQLDAQVRLTGALRAYGPVVGTGDFNVDAARDARHQNPSFPYTRLGAAGIWSNWRTLGTAGPGTHGGRHIDQVTITTDTATFTSQRILGGYGSDHHAVAAEIISRPRPAANPPSAAAAVASRQRPDRLTAAGVTLEADQIDNAAVIIAEGKAAGIPPRGWIIALAAAAQEAHVIRNLNYGDRDSVGLFQQRPSQGWGTKEQIMTPRLAARAFYGVADHTSNLGLVDIPGWQQMTVTQAAQAVQVSGYPDAYARWEPLARDIVDQLADTTAAGSPDNHTEASAACTSEPVGVQGRCPATGMGAEAGLTRDALLVLRCAKQQFPSLTTIYGLGERPGISEHPVGRAVDLMVSDLPGYTPGRGSELGWRIAHWMRTNQKTLGVQYVIYANRIWNIDRDTEGWRDYGCGDCGDTGAHYDHVHITVKGTAGTGPPDPGRDSKINTTGWTLPLPSGRYTVGCGIGCYGGHTGQDFPAAPGTPVYASNSGTVIRSTAITKAGRYVSYGNLIVIRDQANPEITVYYAHLSRRDVQVSDTVTAGQVIGAVGSTGNSKGPHLHYEIRINGPPSDPIPILRRNGLNP